MTHNIFLVVNRLVVFKNSDNAIASYARITNILVSVLLRMADRALVAIVLLEIAI
jgi:hypothetical protein